MTGEALRPRANLVIAAAATLFLADLFLGWHSVAIRMGGVAEVHDTASGWAALAGTCAIAMAAAAAVPYLASPGERTPTTVAPHSGA